MANEEFLKMVEIDSVDGVLEESLLRRALDSVYPNEKEVQKAVKYGEKEFFKYGVTTVHSDDMCSIPPNVVKKALSKATIEIYEHHHIHSLDEMKDYKDSCRWFFGCENSLFKKQLFRCTNTRNFKFFSC